MAWWAGVMGRWADCPVGQIAAVVPVPSHHQSVPHNLPDVLGRAIAERLGLTCLTGLLTGGGSGRETKTLAPRERARALRGTFGTSGISPSGALVVDDLFQTGATFMAAGSALRDAGADVLLGMAASRVHRGMAI